MPGSPTTVREALREALAVAIYGEDAAGNRKVDLFRVDGERYVQETDRVATLDRRDLEAILGRYY